VASTQVLIDPAATRRRLFVSGEGNYECYRIDDSQSEQKSFAARPTDEGAAENSVLERAIGR
jgi:hypothetical protein